MSTRRARIKAVAALPVRRKNTDNNKPILKELKSPRTPRPTHDKEKASPLRSSPRQKEDCSNKSMNTPQSSNLSPKFATPKETSQKHESVIKTPVHLEKSSIFASPQLRRDSPFRLRTASPKLLKKDESLMKPFTTQVEKDSEKILHDVQNQSGKSGTEKQTEALEDYNPPSVPESVTDDPVMDGIVPLQPAKSIPKPIDLLKNEIISENAEVLFDPIVPLPSPSKVRPKLRPAPRLAPLRRNSIQGSASESEDESRRALHGAHTLAPQRQRHDSHTTHSTVHSSNREMNRTRNDSVCSSVSHINAHAAPTSSPVKEKQSSKSRRAEASRRMAAEMRRRKENVKHDALTMYDFIFYNPTSNPIVPDKDEIEAKEANEKEAKEKEAAKDDNVDVEEPTQDAAPVPQIKLGPNGEIILDEQSLVIKQTKDREVSSVVREGAWIGSGGRYVRSARTPEWSAAETVRFYRALGAIGTDFTLMASLFPDRSRRDLKIKFKKEERNNGAQVDRALRSATEWDLLGLEKEFESEREQAAREARERHERLQRERRAERARLHAARSLLRLRTSSGTKAIESSASSLMPRGTKSSVSLGHTADEVIRIALEEKEKQRKRRKNSKTPAIDAVENLATITPLNTPGNTVQREASNVEMATISRVLDTPEKLAIVPSNIENGSLVVLTVNDPLSPSKKMLQTYISHGTGKLTPIALPSNLLNTVVGYMKKGTPKSTGSNSSPIVTSPASVASQDRTCVTPTVIQVNPSPSKRQRLSSYTVTEL